MYQSALVFVGPALISHVDLLFGGIEVIMGRVYSLCRFLGLAAVLIICLNYSNAAGWDISPSPLFDGYAERAVMGTVHIAPGASFVSESCVVYPFSGTSSNWPMARLS